MTLLTRKVDYGLLILSYLYEHAEGGCAREIAARFGLSRAFAANILKELCQKGFVASHRGVNGGYVALRPADEVSLAELMDALDDTFRLAECTQLTPSDGCSLVNVCPVRGPVAELHQRIREILQNVTLGQLLGPGLADSLRVGLPTLTRTTAGADAALPLAY